MKNLKAIGLYAVAVIVLGALLAPWLFWLIQSLGIQKLAEQPFKRFFGRSILLVALVGLWPLLRTLGICSWGAMGYERRPDWWKQVLIGCGLGIISIAVTFAVQYRSLTWLMAHPGNKLAGLIVTAVVVAVLEETLFRGGLQGALQRSMPWRSALMSTSIVYSALHFLKPKGVPIEPNAVTWHSGFDSFGQIMAHLLTTDVVIAFVTLFLAGLILGWAFVKTRSLYLSIGLHGGWVLANEFIRVHVRENIILTPTAWVSLLITGAIVAWLCRNQPTNSQCSPPPPH